jgi:hypothetical protein
MREADQDDAGQQHADLQAEAERESGNRQRRARRHREAGRERLPAQCWL